MFIFGGTAEARQVDTTAPRPAGSPSANLVLAMGIARRSFALIAAAGVGCGLLAFGAGELLTPRYVATAQIYIDPSAMHGTDAQPIVPGRDSNGFVSYVESQALIAASRSVLERVVKAQNLDRDPEFSPGAGRSMSAEDAVAATARALGGRLRIERPERTSVLDVSVSSRDPARAAELANAAARAYIDEVDAMHSDAARQSGAGIAGCLEALRARVLEAEKSVEDYKLANGLVGARDTSLVDQQRKELNDQIIATRQRMSEARARVDQIEVARRKGGDVGADAAQLDLTNLGQLRAQQAEAHKKFVDAAAEFGPRHPQVLDAQASLRAADAAVDGEFARLAQSQRTDYARAKALEASLTQQLEEVERQTKSDDPSTIGLRDLERKASAERDVYELFVNQTRDASETRPIEPTGAKIISAATPPSTRAFPPNSYLLGELGFLAGLGLGYLGALWRGERGLTPAATAVGALDTSPELAPPPEPDPSPPEAAPSSDAAAVASATPVASAAAAAPRLTVGASTTLRIRTRRQSLDRLDLIDLGFPALPESADAGEFEAVLKAVDFTYPRSRVLPPARSRRRFVLVVAGSNMFADRTALAINLALTAARGGARVVLLDAAGRNAKLTRAVRVASRTPILGAGAIYETENDVRLALPKALDAERGRQRPEAMLRNLLDSRDQALDLIVCDGPGASEVEAASVFEYANAIVALDGADEAATLEQLADLGFAPSILVRFETREEAVRKMA